MVVYIGGVRRGVRSCIQSLLIRYDFAAVLNVIFWLPPSGEWVPLGGRRWYCWVWRWYVPHGCQYTITNHRCIWHRL